MCNSICYFFTRYFLTCRNRETVWEILQYVFSDVMEIYDIEEKQTELCWEKMLLTFCFKTTLLKLKCNGLNNSFKVFGTIIGIWSLILHTPRSGKIYHFRRRKKRKKTTKGQFFWLWYLTLSVIFNGHGNKKKKEEEEQKETRQEFFWRDNTHASCQLYRSFKTHLQRDLSRTF